MKTETSTVRNETTSVGMKLLQWEMQLLPTGDERGDVHGNETPSVGDKPIHPEVTSDRNGNSSYGEEATSVGNETPSKQD